MSQIKSIDLTPGKPTVVLNTSQNDVGRVIQLNVTDGSDWYDLTGCTATLVGTKPSGLGFSITGDVSGHQVTITTTKTMTAEYGRISCELRIAKNNDVIGTANMILAVERDPHNNVVDGDAEELIPELTILIERIEADIEEAEEEIAQAEVLKDAEAWAQGTRGGVPVDEEDPAYHNHSKWYASKSDASKIAAQTAEQNAASQALNASGSATAAAASKTDAEAAATRAEAAAAAAGDVFAQVGNVTYSVMEDGGVREIWTKEE